MKKLLIIFILVLPYLVIGQSHYEENINFVEYKVESGKHDFKPNKFKILGSGSIHHRYFVKFNEKSKYIINKEDQLDWCKGGGVSNHLFTNTKNSVMWAFRYNTKIDSFELSPYFNINGGNFYAENLKIPTVKTKNQVIIIDIFRKKHSSTVIMYSEEGVTLCNTTVATEKPKHFSRLIGAWFGGNRTAPHDVYIYIYSLL